jgi:hypothetical protein
LAICERVWRTIDSSLVEFGVTFIVLKIRE